MAKQFLDKDGLQIVAEKVNEAREVGAGAMALAQEVSQTSTIAFTGTFAQWNDLSASEKAKFAGHIVNITDDTTDVTNAVRNPDWSRAISVNFAQLSTGYICPEDGIIIIQVASTDSSVFVTVNNKSICVNNMNQYAAATVAVGTGDVVKSTVTCQEGFIWFIPYTTSLVVTEPLNYSTEEQFTGKYWIDGKKIYRKYTVTGTLPNNTRKSVPHNVSNLNRVIGITGMAYDSNGNQITLPFNNIDANGTVVVWVKNDDIVILTTNDLTAYTESFVIIEYTKTTN